MLVFVWMFAYVSLCQSLYNISGIPQSFDKKTTLHVFRTHITV